MRMMKSIFVLLLTGSSALAQTWFKVASESPTLSLTIPAGTTYRMGNAADNKWSVNQIAPGPVTINVFYPSMGGSFPDPDPGQPKELDILETAGAQTVTLADTSVSPTKVTSIIVPGLAASAAYPPVTFTPGSVYPMAFTNIVVIPNSPAAALLDLVPIPGWEFYAALLQNFTSTFSLGGVTFNCTYGGVLTTTSTVNLNCVPAPVPGH
jgi:hypothetical protein